MKFTRTGVILNTERFDDCREFYASTLGPPVLQHFGHGREEIIVFAFGGSYLMVEHGGRGHRGSKPAEICPAKLRFNVPDVEAAAAELRSKGVEVELFQHDWGQTAEFSDPDGNRCALRSDAGFGS